MTTPAKTRLASLRETEKTAAAERDSIFRDIAELRREAGKNAREIEWLQGLAGAWLTVASAMNNAAMKRGDT
jgi:hypothetical protein